MVPYEASTESERPVDATSLQLKISNDAVQQNLALILVGGMLVLLLAVKKMKDLIVVSLL